MNFVGKMARGFKDFYNEINPATLTGAIDVVVVKQEDGSYKCSPFHVRFGKLGVIRSKEKVVYMVINGEQVDMHMELGEAGEAFFLESLEGEDEPESATTPTNQLTNESTASDSALSTPTPSSNDLNDETGDQVSAVSISNPTENLLQTTSTLDSKTPTPTVTSVETMTVTNYFSDGELTPELTSPAISRPPTPKSDTEIEAPKTKRHSVHDISNQWNWDWGQFPERQNSISSQKATNLSTTPTLQAVANSTSSTPNTATLATVNEANSKSRLGGMLSNLIGINTPDNTGIYLNETDKLDAEVAALYIDPKNATSVKKETTTSTTTCTTSITTTTTNTKITITNDDDMESGKGNSCPQSPLRDFYGILGDVQISLCGLKDFPLSNSSQQKQLRSSSSNSLLNDKSPTQTGLNMTNQQLLAVSPQPTAPVTFTLTPSTPVQQSTLTETSCVAETNYDDLFQQHVISFEKFVEEIHTITTNPNLVVKINNKYMNWPSAAPIIMSAVVFHKPLNSDTVQMLMENNMPKQQTSNKSADANSSNKRSSWLFWSSSSANQNTAASNPKKSPVTTSNVPVQTSDNSLTPTASTSTGAIHTNNQTHTTSLMKKSKTSYEYSTMVQEENNHQNQHAQEVFEKEMCLESQTVSKTVSNGSAKKKEQRKTNRLSSEQIKKLNLKPGPNEIEYSVTTAIQGTTRITSYIFLWEHDDKIIVSDIDGTITRSDVLGQVLPIFGRDWSQAGVADLFTAIERNEYKFIYLSARAIGQSKLTRDLLKNINQGGFKLPEGPLLVTPTSLFTAFQKEVIEKKPEEFKISCLKDIQSLFPKHNNPYYAGYGNKSTDVTAYKTVGIPVSRIFTINPQGELKHEISHIFQSSYSKLCDYVDLIFPPFRAQLNTSSTGHSGYDSFNYWRNSVPVDIMAEIEQEIKETTALAAQTATSQKSKEKKKSILTKNKSQVDVAAETKTSLTTSATSVQLKKELTSSTTTLTATHTSTSATNASILAKN
jgi:phosphatidate phosphatase LPIN